MQNNINNVCRFCLKLVHDDNVEVIDEVTRKMLGVLLIKLDLDMSESPLMCGMCSDILNEIYMFKSKCLYSEDIISTHFETNLKVCLRDILIEIENKLDANIAENAVICRLCIKIPPNRNYVSLNETGMDISFSRDMIQIQLPEIDLSITDEPIICEACHMMLKNYLTFVTNCMDVERKIKLYHVRQGSNDKGQVNLACMLHFTEKKPVECASNLNEDLDTKQDEGPIFVKVEQIEDEQDKLSEDLFVDSSSTELYLNNEEAQIKFDDRTRSPEVQLAENQPHVMNEAMQSILEHTYCRPVSLEVTNKPIPSCDVQYQLTPSTSHGSKLEEKPKQNPYKEYVCIFCNTVRNRIGKHMASFHKDEVEVQQFLKFPKGSKERRRILDEIRKESVKELQDYAIEPIE